MEQSKISIFERFDATSHIIPYYAHTHKAFLLLSSLCSKSRKKLDEYYNEFIDLMKENCSWISNNKDNLLLPSDLFILDFKISKRSSFKKFKKFIKNINKAKGCYFNEHFMHSHIKII